jgi:hypothetical protein
MPAHSGRLGDLRLMTDWRRSHRLLDLIDRG